MSYLICGLDEVGRGSIAGPLFAVAAMFHSEKGAEWRREFSPILGVHDSKTFKSHEKRSEVYHRILRSEKLVDFGIGEVSVEEIDKHGIDEANRIAFYRAWSSLKPEPNWLLVDGDNPAPAWNYSMQTNRPKGDSYWWPVGAASILAKVIRDEYMIGIGERYPIYKWAQNAGYGTPDHIAELKKAGPCMFHRKSFIKNIVGRAA
jgi:ribonuclease HII